ncbi:MAG: hypothetical protein Q8O30_00890 [Candidatus Omnitrophota bacterium]|nr:hypothetical protein [Candidatus Omnitrophota bacterium]
MGKKLMVLVCLLIFSFSCIIDYASAADNIEGTYFVKGWNPGANTTSEPYIGTVTIKKTGEVYQLNWTIANQRHGGVGFYYEDSKRLAVAWSNLNQGDFGEVVYTLEGKTLNGVWTVYGDKTGSVGKEILTKQE